MEAFGEELKDYLVQDNIEAARNLIDVLIKDGDWKEIVQLLKTVTKSLYRKHLLKIHHMVLSIFNLAELQGLDCDLFSEIASIPQPKDIEHASDLLFDNLIEIAKAQFQTGGSTLFFNVEEMKSTRSVVVIPELVEARYREIILVLAEIDELLPSLTKEYIDTTRLWRTGYGLRSLKARNQGLLIHINDYKEIRNLIANELGINPNGIKNERDEILRKGNSDYLRISNELDVFVLSYILSLGVRGKFDPYYKSLIDHEDLDEF